MEKSKLMAFAAICVAAAVSPTFASDLESYRFRYDFSSGEKVFFGSAAVSTDFVTTSAAYARAHLRNSPMLRQHCHADCL